MHGMARLQQDVPWLKTAGLLGCGSYYDAQMEDHRLIIESLLMAQAHGAHIHNYSKVTNINETSSGLGFDVSSRTSGKQAWRPVAWWWRPVLGTINLRQHHW